MYIVLAEYYVSYMMYILCKAEMRVECEIRSYLFIDDKKLREIKELSI